MNCPSRTDDSESKHPTWNQSPPILAADLTTCQDLGGIANLREHKGGTGEARCLLNSDYLQQLKDSPPDAVTTVAGARSFGKSSGDMRKSPLRSPCRVLMLTLTVIQDWHLSHERLPLAMASAIVSICTWHLLPSCPLSEDGLPGDFPLQ